MRKIKKGDQVKVISGKDKGKKGTVLEVFPEDEMLLIEGINTVKKSIRANPQTGDKGGIVIKTLPIHQSKVMIYDPTTERASRVGIKIKEDGTKARYYKSTKELID